MACHHDADPLLVLLLQLEVVHPPHALLQTPVVHLRRRLVRFVDGIFVAQLSCALTLLKRKQLASEFVAKLVAIGSKRDLPEVPLEGLQANHQDRSEKLGCTRIKIIFSSLTLELA